MNPRRLLILGAVAVVAVIVAVFLANRSTESTQGSDALLYPDLKAQADSVKTIRIFKAGDERVLEIVRNGSEWTLTERNGYPIAAAKARNLVRALSNAKLVEEKTADASKYSALSVEDVSGAEAKGVRIELEGPATVVNVIVGKDGPGGKTSYVRRAGEPKSWLVSEQLAASPEPRDWLDKEIVNLSADRIQSATIATGKGKPYTAAKASRTAADFAVEPLPKGKELSGTSAANGAATALLNLSLDDVLAKQEVATGKADDEATYKTFDGLIVEVDGFKRDDKYYVTLSASYDAGLAEQFKLKTTEDDKAKTAEPGKAEGAQATAVGDAAGEAEKISTKVSKWAYEIPGYKYDAIFRPLDELLKK